VTGGVEAVAITKGEKEIRTTTRLLLTALPLPAAVKVETAETSGAVLP
jgi:hypothetical protein